MPECRYCHNTDVAWLQDGKGHTYLYDTQPVLHVRTCKARQTAKKDALPATLAHELGCTTQAAQRALKAAGGDWEAAVRVLLQERGAEMEKER